MPRSLQMMCLHLFPYLKTLCLIHQDLKEICNLEECVNLERLWVVENDITHIRGLGTLRNLRELFLYSNKIKVAGRQTAAEGLGACGNVHWVV